MEGDERDNLSQAPDSKPSFLLKIKIKYDPGYPNQEYYAIFEHTDQNIRSIPEVKKSVLANGYKNIIKQKNSSKARCRQINLVCSVYKCRFGGGVVQS